MRQGNGFDPDQISRHLRIVDAADDELASLLGTYRADCRGPRSRIKDSYTLAKEQGLNLTALRAVTAKHRAEKAHERRLAELEPDDRDDYQAMREALGGLGDLPLGEAALKRAKPRDEEALNTLGT
jgi:hypothetical protein